MGNVARPLAAEREYLRLERTDHDRRITEAVAKQAAAVSTFDQRIAPPDPTCSPVQVDTLERFADPWADRVGFRYHGLGGRDILVALAVEYDDPELEADVRAFVAQRLARKS